MVRHVQDAINPKFVSIFIVLSEFLLYAWFTQRKHRSPLMKNKIFLTLLCWFMTYEMVGFTSRAVRNHDYWLFCLGLALVVNTAAIIMKECLRIFKRS